MVIGDATTLGALICIGKADIALKLVGKVKVSDETARELLQIAEARCPGTQLPEDVIEVVPVDVSYASFSTSETETLELGRQIKAKLLISDDVALRREARKDKIVSLGMLGLLYAAKRRVLIPNVEDTIELLRKIGYLISPACEQVLISRAGAKGKSGSEKTIFDFRL